MVKAGHPLKAAVKKHHVNYTALRNACILTGVEPPHASRVIGQTVWSKLDWTLRDADLAKLLGVSREWVRRKRLELGREKVGKATPAMLAAHASGRAGAV
jgi:hypothetical protein